MISGYLWFDIEGLSQFRFHFQFVDFISSENRTLHEWVNVRQTYISHILGIVFWSIILVNSRNISYFTEIIKEHLPTKKYEMYH